MVLYWGRKGGDARRSGTIPDDIFYNFTLSVKQGIDILRCKNYLAFMEVRFRDMSLDSLETTPGDAGWPPGVVKAFRKRLALIRAADDERVFYGLKSLHYEKLKGKRQHQRSMKLNDQWRLVLELEGKGSDKVVWIVSIEDYH